MSDDLLARERAGMLAAEAGVPLPLNDDQVHWIGELGRWLGRVPDGMHGAIVRYVLCGWPTGDFLRALLANDLMEACGRADENNQRAIFDWCVLLHNGAPGPCFGSPELVNAWIDQGGLATPDPAS